MNSDDDLLANVQDNYDEIFEMNTAIVGFARQKVLDLREAAEMHRTVADGYDEIANAVAQMSLVSAELIAKGIAVEAGLRDEGAEDDD